MLPLKNNLQTLKADNGFSLTEILVVSLITVIVGGFIVSILFNTTGIYYNQSAQTQQSMDLNDTFSKVRSSIRQSKFVATGYPEGSPTYTSGINTLVLKIPSVNSSGNTISDTYDFAIVTKSQDKLYYKLFPDAISARSSDDQILASNVDNVYFNYYDSAGTEVNPETSSRIKITLTLKQKAGAGYKVNTATSEASIRNQ